MKISKVAFAVHALLFSTAGFAAAPEWQSIQDLQIKKQVTADDYPKAINKINDSELAAYLQAAPLDQKYTQGLKVELPLPNGETSEFFIWESPIMEEGLAQKFPNIKTYRGYQVQNPQNSGRFDMVDGVFHGSFQLNGKSVYIDPVADEAQDGLYRAYFKADFMQTAKAQKAKKDFQCKVKGHEHSTITHIEKAQKASASPIELGETLRTYRLAVTTTGEYGKYFGTKEKAVASVVTAINRVNEVYQRDLSVKLELVANNDKVVYIDPTTDPFNGNDDGNTLIEEVGKELNKTIGSENYDVGHVFSTGGGGLAGLGVVCSAYKAEGVTGSSTPTGDPYWIDYVAHELGHQFNSEHSFNGSADACSGNRAASWAYEPGSASTIMSYAGICGDENLQNNSDAYFHTTSIEQIKTHITGSADACAKKSSLGNEIPKVNAGADGVIPKETPFKLTAEASDTDSGDSLLYSWEQRDLGDASSSADTLIDDGKRPIFRSWLPESKATRYLPRLTEVLAGGVLVKGEAWPTTSRDLNFVVTVRDQKGGITSDARLVKVDANAGPFTAKFPAASSHFAPKSKQYAQWDVANTTAAPISCSSVDIKLSVDDGATFTSLLERTANDGQELVTLPEISSDKARFFIECSSQPFYAVTQGFKISSAGTSETETPPGGGSSNNAPRLADDSYTIVQDSSNYRMDLLVNDKDPDGDSIKISKVTDVTDSANVTISGDGQYVSYTPAADFNGNSNFSYEVTDAKGAIATAKVSVKVEAETANNAPRANDDDYDIGHNASNIQLNLLANDSDPDSGDSLQIVGVSSVTDDAKVTISDDKQSVVYSPASGFSGSSSFEYEIHDSKGASSKAKVTINVASAAPAPTPGPETGGSSGGGSANWLLLGLLLIARRFKK